MSFSIEKKSEKCHRLRLVEANSSLRNPSQKDWNGGRLSSNMIRLIGVVNRSLSADDVFPSSGVSGHFQLVSSPSGCGKVPRLLKLGDTPCLRVRRIKPDKSPPRHVTGSGRRLSGSPNASGEARSV